MRKGMIMYNNENMSKNNDSMSTSLKSLATRSTISEDKWETLSKLATFLKVFLRIFQIPSCSIYKPPEKSWKAWDFCLILDSKRGLAGSTVRNASPSFRHNAAGNEPEFFNIAEIRFTGFGLFLVYF